MPLALRSIEIHARKGVEPDRSTMADWVGGASRDAEAFRIRPV